MIEKTPMLHYILLCHGHSGVPNDHPSKANPKGLHELLYRPLYLQYTGGFVKVQAAL